MRFYLVNGALSGVRSSLPRETQLRAVVAAAFTRQLVTTIGPSASPRL